MSTRAKAKYIMIGGFLGAGKTTAVARLAEALTRQGLKVGLITNDQGQELVDTHMLRSKGFPTEEIAGGCFCCRFHSLVDAADRLATSAQPDVFIAEPVGSCTDLVATVTYPLRRMYGDNFAIAPVSVLVDPVRCARVLGLSPGAGFSEKVVYIYKKQLEEADLIVINKVDQLGPEDLAVLKDALTQRFPRARVLSASARNGAGLDAWFAELTGSRHGARPTMEVDYDLYAEGEALLGWLNATIAIEASQPFEANAFLQDLATQVQRRLSEAEIAHLKMTLSPRDALGGEIAAVSLVRSDFVPELSLRLSEPVPGGHLIINLRAESSPDLLAAAVEGALEDLRQAWPTLSLRLEHLEHFRPGRPTPTHRDLEPQR